LRLGLLSVVYARSYTAPHVVVVYALLGGVASLVLRQRWDLRLLVAPVAARSWSMSSAGTPRAA